MRKVEIWGYSDDCSGVGAEGLPDQSEYSDKIFHIGPIHGRILYRDHGWVIELAVPEETEISVEEYEQPGEAERVWKSLSKSPRKAT